MLSRLRIIELMHQMAMKLMRRLPVEATKTKNAMTILRKIP
jgi:hypothetical protein